VSYLLDTNVVSDLRKRVPDQSVTSWFASVRASDLYLSVVVVGEIRSGIERLARRGRDQVAGHEKWLADLLDLYDDRIVAVTAEVAETWGRLNVPDPLPVVDGLLAATALVHDWTLVTRNTADVRGTGVRLLNPFTSGRPT
jgi:predicted nucleic acid-binding protein